MLYKIKDLNENQELEVELSPLKPYIVKISCQGL